MRTPPRSRGTATARAPHSAVARRVQLPLQEDLHTAGLGGAALVAAAVAGVAWANSPWAASYDGFWQTPMRVSLGSWAFQQDLRHVVNDGLMAIFFFVVRLEIKRELIEGSLSDRRRAMLPVVAAVGGMVVPAALYALVVAARPGASGWGIPMATDIAFALAVLGLTGAPHNLKVLLLALAIGDDIGAILVIALFYTAEFSAAAAIVALLCIAVVLLMQRVGFTHMVVYAPVAAIFWIAVLESGVHAAIAGVILGALTPPRALVPHRTFVRTVHQLGDRLSTASAERNAETDMLAGEVEELARQSESPLERAERLFHPWSSFAVLPLFALANSGIALTADAMQTAMHGPVASGVLLGLVVGKPLGITAFSWIAAVGVLAGIGFTVSLFITDLAFDDETLIGAAKSGIFAASTLAAIGGWIGMRRVTSHYVRHQRVHVSPRGIGGMTVR